jgi:hypothetical protein
MCKTLTIRNLIAILMLAMSSQNAFSQAAFWSETFSTPSGFAAWTSANAGAGIEVWGRSVDPAVNMGFAAAPTAFTSATAADGFAFYNSDANGQANVHSATLTSQPINCTAHNFVGLRFSSQFADFQGSDAEVRVSIDGGTTWTAYPLFDDQPSYGSGAAQAALVPAILSSNIYIAVANNQPQVWLQFRWGGDWEYGWKLDDIELFDTTPPTASVTFKVNAALLTVDPAGMKIAGSFNSFTDANMTNEGNGVWSYTLTGATIGSEIKYKFKNGPSGWEAGQPGCGVSDGFGGYNRTYTPANTTPATLPAVCFNACAGCVVACAQNPDAIICDNLDTYVTTLKVGPQATWWTTWSGTAGEGTAEDGIVSTEQAASAPNSMKVISVTAGTGPQDVMLDLGTKTTGNYSLKWKFYVPSTKQGYYNIQNVVPLAGGAWNLDVLFDAGVGTASVTQVDKFSFAFPHDAWFTIEHRVDLDNNLLKYYVNNVYAGSIPYPNDLGGIDFFGTTATSVMYVDDVEYVKLPSVVYNVDVCDAAVDLTPLFGGAEGVAQTSALFDNTTATAAATDPIIPAAGCWGESSVTNSQWFNFPGDGKRYHIETVPCTATNYIGTAANDLGDTQMAIFSGADCAALTPVICSDDLFTSGDPDWRAGLDIETVAGENYYILIDGYRFNNVVAIGEYCIQVTQGDAILCAQGAVGDLELANNGYLCFEENLTTAMQFDPTEWAIPTIGPVYGNAWCISANPLDPTVWPGTITGIASTPVSPSVGGVNLINDGLNFPAGLYYLTPVVVGGGTLIDPAGLARVFNVEPGANCFYVGTSVPMTLMPDPDELEPISGTIEIVAGPNGTNLLDLSVAGGLGELIGDESYYTYLWSNGATTQDITVNDNANYTVTISDISGCDGIESFTAVLTGVKDPTSVKALTIAPNPTNDNFNVSLTLENALDVRAELVNSVGQVLRSFNYGNVSRLNETINVTEYADGVYFLRLSIDGQKTQRSIVVAH